jgi:hypothetical protein
LRESRLPTSNSSSPRIASTQPVHPSHFLLLPGSGPGPLFHLYYYPRSQFLSPSQGSCCLSLYHHYLSDSCALLLYVSVPAHRLADICFSSLPILIISQVIWCTSALASQSACARLGPDSTPLSCFCARDTYPPSRRPPSIVSLTSHHGHTCLQDICVRHTIAGATLSGIGPCLRLTSRLLVLSLAYFHIHTELGVGAPWRLPNVGTCRFGIRSSFDRTSSHEPCNRSPSISIARHSLAGRADHVGDLVRYDIPIPDCQLRRTLPADDPRPLAPIFTTTPDVSCVQKQAVAILGGLCPFEITTSISCFPDVSLNASICACARLRISSSPPDALWCPA